MNHKKLFLGLIAAATFSAVASIPTAYADPYGRHDRWNNYDRSWDRRSDWGELRRERAELQRDLAELDRDRADLRRMYRYGASPSVSLHDVTGSQRKIVGILTIGQKLAYRVPPGRHEFMLQNRGSTDFLEANVAAGKTYYVVLQRTDDSYDQRYGFRPVRSSDFGTGLFARWETNLSYVDRREAWERWSKANDASIESRSRDHRLAWEKLGPAERSLKTLRVSDGR